MRNLVVGTAGHIDHGKSSLVRALTGIDPDRLKEEKARGITIELGFAHTTIGDTRVAFVDVPGHERFVRTMLAGVGGIDCVLLIVASDESVMPQTREHFDICRLLRIPRGIVVLTKSDLADADTRALVRHDVAELVKGSFLEQAPVIEVSAATGDGLDRLRDAIAAEAGHAARRPADGAARLPIDRAFSMKGFGTVVTGTLVSGTVKVDDELVIEPGGVALKVRGVQVHGRAADAAVAGQRAAINLGGVELADVSRGETLMARGTLSVSRRVDAEIDLLRSAKPLKHGARVRMHNGTAEVLGRVSIAGQATEIAAGESALVRLRLEQPAVLTRSDRFIIRAYSPPITIGGGVVIDPAPARAGIRSEDGRASLARLRLAHGGHSASKAETTAIVSMIEAAGLAGIEAPSLVSRAGVMPGRIADVMRELSAAGVVAAGDRLVMRAVLEKAERDLVALVTATHKANAMSDGLPREEARSKLFARIAPAVFETVVDQLKARKALVGAERLALPTHKPTVAGGDDRVREAIIEAYRAAGLKAPDAATVEGQAKAPAAVVEKLTSLLLRERVLIRLDTVIFHADALQALKQDVRAMKEGAAGGRATVDVAAFKDRYGLSRKFAIPLLEYLDRERVTRRTGDVRLVL
ncbi:MAG TPA: selenocysteine-specific translation elongation factor [Vicinamibacterales bacterium]|nr:selenocysteine-specific translation elongation factor [Vicinamibacterales bacterium]